MPDEPHGAFSVQIDVDQFYDWEPLKAGAKAKDGEVTTETVTGTAVRRLRDEESVTTINFGPGAFELIAEERAAANLPEQSFERMVAAHIEDAAMALHAPRGAWVRLHCPSDKKLEQFLNLAFGLPRGPRKKGKGATK